MTEPTYKIYDRECAYPFTVELHLTADARVGTDDSADAGCVTGDDLGYTIVGGADERLIRNLYAVANGAIHAYLKRLPKSERPGGVHVAIPALSHDAEGRVM